MNSSGEEVLLDSCCILLNYHQEQIRRKGKRTWVQEISKKRIEEGVYHNLLQEHFSESNEEKCTAFQSMAWSLILSIKVLLKIYFLLFSFLCAYQGVRNVFLFRKIWHALFSWNTCFEIHPFALLPTKSWFRFINQ